MRFLRRFFKAGAGGKVTVGPATPPLGGTLRSRDVRWDVEDEHDRLGREQVSIWQADGIKAAKAARTEAATANPLAEGVRDVLTVAWRRVEETAEAWSEGARRLQGQLPLTQAEVRRYWVTFVLLVGGDVCGVTGAGVMLGEIPAVALLQAIGSGTAAVTAGLIATELRRRQMAHLFGRDPVPADGREAPRFTVLGLDPDDFALRAALVLVGAISVAIFAMRTVQGPMAAVGFSLLNLATCIGSFLNAWHHARPAAEILAGYQLAHEQAKAEYLALAGHEAVAREASALSQAHRIEAEHAARGDAARQHLWSQLWATFRRHPSIYGHGVADLDGERREFHNGDSSAGLGFQNVPPTSLRHARIGRRAARPAARDVHGHQAGDAAQ